MLVALGIVAAALTLLLLHFGLVRRLRRLAEASEGLTRGDLIELRSVGRDEIGALAQDFVAMGRTVIEREQSISAATAKKKLVLDNAGNGLVTCDVSGRLVGERIAGRARGFGAPAPGAQVWDYLADGDESLQRELRRDFQSVGRRALDVPLRRQIRGRVLDCRWSSVRAGVAGSIVLLVMHDASELVAQRRREEEERQAQRLWSERSRNAYRSGATPRWGEGVPGYRCSTDGRGNAGGYAARRRGRGRAPLRPILQGLAEMAGSVAHKLGKELTIDVRAAAQRIDRERTAPLWASLVHVVRNAVDHGIEPRDEREACGKPGAGRLARRVDRGRHLFVTISDDGRGIDWARVAAKPQSKASRTSPRQTSRKPCSQTGSPRATLRRRYPGAASDWLPCASGAGTRRQHLRELRRRRRHAVPHCRAGGQGPARRGRPNRAFASFCQTIDVRRSIRRHR